MWRQTFKLNLQTVSPEISYNDSQELIACKVKLSTNQSLIACCIYRPPNRSVDNIEALCGSLESIVLSYPHDILWIAGDLHLPDINWTDSNIAGNNYPLPLNTAFLNSVNTFGLTLIVDFPTRQSNTPDIFLTNRPSLIELCVPIAGISDHEAVLTKSNINIIADEQSRRKIYLWNRTDSNQIRAFFCDFCNEFLNNNSINTPVV